MRLLRVMKRILCLLATILACAFIAAVVLFFLLEPFGIFL